jgi:hypothetical protein
MENYFELAGTGVRHQAIELSQSRKLGNIPIRRDNAATISDGEIVELQRCLLQLELDGLTQARSCRRTDCLELSADKSDKLLRAATKERLE